MLSLIKNSSNLPLLPTYRLEKRGVILMKRSTIATLLQVATVGLHSG